MADFQFTQSGAQIQADLNLTENLQDAFSTSATYAVGDLVIYNSKIYKCHTAVSVAGAWTGSTNWTEANLGSLLTSLTDADIDLALSAEIITATITNGTAKGDTVIAGTATVNIVPNDGYDYPSSVTVTGATSSYDDSTGVISLSGATGEVSITAVCVAGYTVTLDGYNGNGERVYVQINNDPTWYYAELDSTRGFTPSLTNIPNAYTLVAGYSIGIPNVSNIKIGTGGDPTTDSGPHYISTDGHGGDLDYLTFTATGSSAPAYATSQITITQNSGCRFGGSD